MTKRHGQNHERSFAEATDSKTGPLGAAAAGLPADFRVTVT